MNREKIIELLNKNRANEITAIMQYMNHHYQVSGQEFLQLRDLFKELAIVEMQHAEKLAERINLLGGKPISRNEAIAQYTDLKVIEAEEAEDMVKADLEYEQIAINDYTDHLKQINNDDPVTRKMLEDILGEEEDHADDLSTWLGQKQMPFGLKAVGEE